MRWQQVVRWEAMMERRKAQIIQSFRKWFEDQIGDREQDLETISQAKEALDKIASRLEEEKSLYQQQLRAVIEGRVEVSREGIVISEEAEPKSTRFQGMKIGDAAYEVLKEADRPLHVREIWDRISEGGVESRAKKPWVSIAAALYRDERFENLGRNTFRIKEGTQ